MANVTTIIPTKCRPLLLKRAIESVVTQTYPRLRLAIYDNASGDETPDIVRSFANQDPRIHLYTHPQAVSSGENFQFGLQQVTTPFFSFYQMTIFFCLGFIKRLSMH